MTGVLNRVQEIPASTTLIWWCQMDNRSDGRLTGSTGPVITAPVIRRIFTLKLCARAAA